MPPAHMIYFTLLVLHKIKAQWGFRVRSIGDSDLFSAQKADWILIAGMSLCILVQTALALF